MNELYSLYWQVYQGKIMSLKVEEMNKLMNSD